MTVSESMSQPQYTIRWLEPADVDDFIALYTEIFDTWDASREWFAWKYDANPYVDHVPIVVTELDGEIVGARPFFALPMAIGGHQQTALQPADTMVHADHRGQGLFTRMTKRAIDHYGEREPAFFFNFPNDQSRSGYEKLGWAPVGLESRYYRIQNPERILARRDGPIANRIVEKICGPLVTAYTKLRDEFAEIPRNVPIRKHSTVPEQELASMYRRSVPGAIHAVRDETFLGWRFDNPNWEYTTYVTDSDADPVAMIVGDAVGLSTGVTVTRIVDTLPLHPNGRDDQLRALLDRILTERAESDIIVTPASMFPDEMMRPLGFYCDEWPPLNIISRGRTHIARSLTGWDANELDIRDPDNWSLSFIELDTS